MSIISTGVLSADPAAEKLHKKSFHRRNDSGELDVFEAARYFSGYNEAPSSNTNNNTPTFSQKVIKEDRSWRGGRISLDMPIGHMIHYPQQYPHHQVVVEKPNFLKDKKYKQPSSPGGRLASFLNSLFSQSASKKKSKSSSTQSMKDEEESPGARRRRRSSISHFRSSSTADSKSIYSSSSSDLRTPPLQKHAQTVASKSYKDTRSHSDHKQQQQQQVVFLSKNSTALDDKKSNRELSWLDREKLTYTKGFSEKYKINSDQDHKGLLRRLSEVVGDDQDEDEGAESDSSSDLFELQNYDLGCYSSGLPVYETTNVENIKIRSGTPISNASS